VVIFLIMYLAVRTAYIYIYTTCNIAEEVLK
jgi:hypothetical protein